MNKIFSCPQLAGCHLPLYKTSDSIFISAKNVDEAKKSIKDIIKRRCEEDNLQIVEFKGSIKLEGGMSNDVYYVSEMRRTEACKRLEERLKILIIGF